MRTEDAIAHGIKTTAGVVTSAAIVMVFVFSIFATLSLIMMKQFGVGLAAAVLIDATIVRGVLLPATMKLLGEWNWYLPRWLGWLPKVKLEGGARRSPPRRLARRWRAPRSGRSSPPRPTGRCSSTSRSWRSGVSASPLLIAGWTVTLVFCDHAARGAAADRAPGRQSACSRRLRRARPGLLGVSVQPAGCDAGARASGAAA